MEEGPKVISLEMAKRIVEKLAERGVQPQCPRCSQSAFSIVDGYMALSMGRNLEEIALVFGNRQFFPVAAMVCRNCGFVSLHSLAVLELMETFQKGG